MKLFKDHILTALSYNEDEQTISLTIDDNKIFLIKLVGDCCSEGKFIGVSDSYRFELPQKIVEVTDRKEEFQDGEYKVSEYTLVLEDKGKIRIAYDNKSNGYYGSSLDVYYGGERVYNFSDIADIKEKTNG